MNNLTNINPVLPVKEKRVPFGTVIWIGFESSLYIVAQPSYKTMSLISLRDGNRWEELSTCVVCDSKDHGQTVSEVYLDSVIRLHNNTYEWGYVRSVTLEVANE